ncbi:MAG TPA: hypothetical protein VKM35_00455 [Arenimonas sp.]|uniref:hypothetical protein n=1 Tax=Arenimonas sp. TaxID=1872635 RepID=UPI002C4EDDB1|nr:hypothetical protein [Arenimonas sp.]HMB55662.1 hypothetical protein [Arenimonas sp.]
MRAAEAVPPRAIITARDRIFGVNDIDESPDEVRKKIGEQPERHAARPNLRGIRAPGMRLRTNRKFM